jgi:hypothetical protein
MINIIKAAVTIAASTVGPPLVASCRRWREDKRRGENKKVLVLLAERHSVWLALPPHSPLSPMSSSPPTPSGGEGLGKREEGRMQEDNGIDTWVSYLVVFLSI